MRFLELCFLFRKRNGDEDADMRFFRICILLVFLCIILPAGLFAQAGDFSVSIDFRTGYSMFGIVPGIPAVIGVPMSITPDTVTITPQFGFEYFFNVMTDLHNPFYVPLGANVIYNPVNTGIDVMYFVPVGGTVPTHMLSAAVVSELEIFSRERFSLLFEMKIGPMFIFDPDQRRVFLMVNSVLIPRFKL